MYKVFICFKALDQKLIYMKEKILTLKMVHLVFMFLWAVVHSQII